MLWASLLLRQASTSTFQEHSHYEIELYNIGKAWTQSVAVINTYWLLPISKSSSSVSKSACGTAGGGWHFLSWYAIKLNQKHHLFIYDGSVYIIDWSVFINLFYFMGTQTKAVILAQNSYMFK